MYHELVWSYPGRRLEIVGEAILTQPGYFRQGSHSQWTIEIGLDVVNYLAQRPWRYPAILLRRRLLRETLP
jgi:hypothetical protein